MPVNVNKAELDNMTPAEIRVICEKLLYGMDGRLRQRLIDDYPGFYKRLFPKADMKPTGIVDK